MKSTQSVASLTAVFTMTRIEAQSRSPRPLIQRGVPSLAEGIIRAATREHPADGVMRAELKAQRGLSREEGARVSRAVFAYFRWRGWLDEGRPIREQVERALALAERYASKPESFTDAELIARAVPGWLPAVMKVTAAWVRALQREPKLWLRARRGQGGRWRRNWVIAACSARAGWQILWNTVAAATCFGRWNFTRAHSKCRTSAPRRSD